MRPAKRRRMERRKAEYGACPPYVPHAGSVVSSRPLTCGHRQEGDEHMCPGCGLRWDLREDRPPCPR